MKYIGMRTFLSAGVSALVLAAVAGGAFAQDANPTGSTGADDTTATAKSSKTSKDDQVVIVTARRKALQDAVDRKKNSDTIIDSVVADDAGKLPDNSITEVLARVTGVAITRFSSDADVDHYSSQGSGLTVRGLSGMTSTLNGRQSFSANGSRGLLWEDVPPELMASVDVYKASTSDLIEGGLAGSINLNTRLPFDYKGQELAGTFYDSYGDMVKQGRSAASILYSNRWDTNIGRVGLLLDASYAGFIGKNNTMQVGEYQPAVGFNDNIYIPDGYSYRENTTKNLRTGLYEAGEWSPRDGLTLYQTVFYSDKRQVSYDDGLLAGGTQYQPVAGSHYTVGSNGGLLEADQLAYAGWSVLPCPGGQGSCGYANADTGVSNNFNQTTDITEGLTWQATEHLRIKAAIQYVGSSSNNDSFNVYSETTFPSFGFDATGKFPKITLGQTTTDPADWIWYSTMDQYSKNSGRALAANVDADMWLSDTDFLRHVKVGLRVDNQYESDDSTPYNWQGLSPWWSYWSFSSPQAGCSSLVGNLHCLAASPSADYQVITFKNFFKGKLSEPAALFPSTALTATGDVTAWQQEFGAPGNTNGPIPFVPDDLTSSRTHNSAIYVRADFGLDDVFGMKMNGNFGLRLVRNDNQSEGYVLENGGGTATVMVPLSYNCVQPVAQQPQGIPSGYKACNIPNVGGYNNSGGRLTYNLLPSVNVQFLPNPDMHIRFAYSQGLTLPSFYNAAANGSYSLTENGLPQGYLVNPQDPNAYLSGSIGNPELKPQISDNYDASFEWYMPHNGLFQWALFDKDIKDYITSEPHNQMLPEEQPDGTVEYQQAVINNTVNSKGGELRGSEIGYRKFFDFLPKPFDGLGLDANATYIDSHLAGDSDSTDIRGNPIAKLPLTGLSKWTYNIQLMYEKDPFSLHIGWNWRSKYLLSPTGVEGSYSDPTCPEIMIGAYQQQAQGTCNYSLPVYSAPYGQLDAGFSYRINPHVNIGFEANNLTNSISRTLQGSGSQQYGRSWFMGDTFYRLTVSFHM